MCNVSIGTDSAILYLWCDFKTLTPSRKLYTALKTEQINDFSLDKFDHTGSGLVL